jgi:hypothetical protein
MAMFKAIHFIQYHLYFCTLIEFVRGVHLGPYVEVEVYLPTPPWHHEDRIQQKSSLASIPLWAHQDPKAATEAFCGGGDIGDLNPENCELLESIFEASMKKLEVINAEAKAIAAHISSTYDARALQTYNALLSISSVIQRFKSPKVIVFGSGRDSRMLCAASLEGKPLDSFVIFVEDNEEWGQLVQGELDEYLTSRQRQNDNDDSGSDMGRCIVVGIQYDTKREDWIDYLGMQDKLAAIVLSSIINSIQSNSHFLSNERLATLLLTSKNLESMFDVVLVDGPAGASDNNPGRMSTIAAASKLVKLHDDGVVFIDDIDRTVERVFSQSMLRPLFKHEVDVRVNWRPLRYYTNDDSLTTLLAARDPPTKLVDFNGLKNDVG